MKTTIKVNGRVAVEGKLLKCSDLGVYCFKNSATNEVVYIGSGALTDRKSTHMSLLKHSKHKKDVMQDLYDESNIEFEVLAICEEEELIELENKYMSEFKPQCNVNRAGRRMIGTTRIKETVKRRKSNTGENNPKCGLSKEDVITIKAMIEIGMRLTDIGNVFAERGIKITQSNLSNIKTGTRWSHITI